MRRARIAFPIMFALAVHAPALSAQRCRAANDSSYDMIEMVKSYALATDSIGQAVRDSLRIPAAASVNGVVLVTKAATCKAADRAYKAAASGATTTLSGQVFVVQVGTRYIVWDPAYRVIPAHPADVYVVFDSQWRVLRKF